jgi:FHS family glucose/mannose:H+ symporter-like MFS transporter
VAKPLRITWTVIGLTASLIVLSGCANVLIGPSLPFFTRAFHLTDARAGRLFIINFGAGILGSILSTLRLRISLPLGALCMGLGATCLTATHFSIVCCGFALIGLGLDIFLGAANVYVGALWPQRRSGALAWMNVFWSIGALSTAPAFTALQIRMVPKSFFLCLGLLLGVGALALLTAGAPRLGPVAVEVQTGSALAMQEPMDQTSAVQTSLSLSTALIFVPVALLTIGVEHDIGGWLPTYSIRNFSIGSQSSEVVAAYWGGELVSRLLMPFLLRYLQELQLYRCCLFLMLAAYGSLLFIRPLDLHALMGLACLAGMAIGPLYPLCVSFLLARAGRSPRLGFLFASSGFGGAICGWATGVIATSAGSLRAGLILPLAIVLILLGFSRALLRQPLCKQVVSIE